MRGRLAGLPVGSRGRFGVVVIEISTSAPALRLINFNYLPLPTNVYLGKSPSPWNLIYSEPQLAPGGDGTGPTVEIPPEYSAYTGLNGDVPPPPGWGGPPGAPGSGPPPGPRGVYAPNGLPADPQPARREIHQALRLPGYRARSRGLVEAVARARGI